jgi:hypothetical protein
MFTHAFFLIALMMEAAGTSEMSVNVYQTTRRSIPEDIHLQGSIYGKSRAYSVLEMSDILILGPCFPSFCLKA